MNSTISIKKIEFAIKNVPTKKTSDSYHFSGKFYQTFKEEITLIIYIYISKYIWGEKKKIPHQLF